MKILLGLTTTRGSDWRQKIKEIKELGLKEVAIFLTTLEPDERKEMYSLLENSGIESIPFVHLRGKEKTGTETWEIDLFVQKFGAKIFNVHSDDAGYEIIRQNPQYRHQIFVENSYPPELLKEFTSEDFKKNQVAGICLDISHLEYDRILFPEQFKKIAEMIKLFPIGCNHISGSRNGFWRRLRKKGISEHKIKNLSDFDYLKNYPKNYFSDCVVIEVENSFKEQLKFQEYIGKIIK